MVISFSDLEYGFMRDVDLYCSGILNGSQRPQFPRSLPTEVSESQDFSMLYIASNEWSQLAVSIFSLLIYVVARI